MGWFETPPPIEVRRSLSESHARAALWVLGILFWHTRFSSPAAGDDGCRCDVSTPLPWLRAASARDTGNIVEIDELLPMCSAN
jgi:hypothetical protein